MEPTKKRGRDAEKENHLHAAKKTQPIMLARQGDWAQHVSTSSGRRYFYNRKTKESRWTKPSEWVERPRQPLIKNVPSGQDSTVGSSGLAAQNATPDHTQESNLTSQDMDISPDDGSPTIKLPAPIKTWPRDPRATRAHHSLGHAASVKRVSTPRETTSFLADIRAQPLLSTHQESKKCVPNLIGLSASVTPSVGPQHRYDFDSIKDWSKEMLEEEAGRLAKERDRLRTAECPRIDAELKEAKANLLKTKKLQNFDSE